ncbi:MAG: VWA domain-containing protein [Thermoguttaceae bacterium]|nr:VWA domain-containing protein [Thermoguttaceae bacterium]
MPGRKVQSGGRQRRVYGPDRIGIVGFSDRGVVLAKPADPFDPQLLAYSQKLHEQVGGLTNLADGLRQAVRLLEELPLGIWRRIWLLSDGYPNVEVGKIDTVVEQAKGAGVRVCAIGFGDQFDEALLRRISQASGGRFVSVQSLRALTEALVRATGGHVGRNRRRHPSETAVLAIDLSGSMAQSMEGKTKVAVVEEAVLQLLHYKQKCWS